MILSAPDPALDPWFARELLRLQHRASAVSWLHDERALLVREWDRDAKWTRLWKAVPGESMSMTKLSGPLNRALSVTAATIRTGYPNTIALRRDPPCPPPAATSKSAIPAGSACTLHSP